MATNLYLAMTAAEYHETPSLPSRIAWMACHFSPYAVGLSNVPSELPPDSLLILSDVIPIHGHDPQVIARQLEACMQENGGTGLLLDFQRYPCCETEALAEALIQALPCPVALAEPFAADKSCPIFLPPCPPHIPLKEYLLPWDGREIWLEAAFSPTQLQLTASGTIVTSNSGSVPEHTVFSDDRLHCHYCSQVQSAQATFQLWRTKADLEALLDEGSALGITRFVGLYQELHGFTQ